MSAHPLVGNPLVGAWRYVDATLAGRSTRPNGRGMIYYAPTGEMMCQVFPGTVVARAGDKPSPQEALAALDGTIAYFGTYSIDQRAQTVTHHRQGSVQPGDTADLVRRYSIDGDDLTLNPPGTDYKVHWRRIG